MSNEMMILQKEYYEVNERQRKIFNMQFDGFLGKLTSGKWAKIGKCSTDTALNDIKNLLGKGVLRKNDEGGRFAFRTNERTNKRGASRRDRSLFRLFLWFILKLPCLDEVVTNSTINLYVKFLFCTFAI